jgi:hypothetical protein
MNVKDLTYAWCTWKERQEHRHFVKAQGRDGRYKGERKVGVEVERRGWSGSGFWIFEPLKFMRRESGRNTKRLGRDKSSGNGNAEENWPSFLYFLSAALFFFAQHPRHFFSCVVCFQISLVMNWPVAP